MSQFVSIGNWTTPEAPWSLTRKEILMTPPERVWSALTEPDDLRQWWCDDADVDLRVGGHLRFGGPHVFAGDLLPSETPTTERDALSGANFEILVIEPNERLTFRWCLGNAETRVEMALENLLEQTHLRVTQSAIERLAWPIGESCPNWWWVALPALRNLLENGDPGLRLNYDVAARAEQIKFEVPMFTFPWVIWQKLTDPTELARWWARQAVVELEAGGLFELGLDDGGPSQILAVDEGIRLTHNWHWSEDCVSRVEWRIEENDTDTRVSVADLGPWPADLPRERLALFWATSLVHLKQMSERGVTPRQYQD